MQRLLLFFLIILTSMSQLSFAKAIPLAADKAFKVTVKINNAKELTTVFDIASGYYLYTQRLNFNFKPQTNAAITIPKGIILKAAKVDEREVLAGRVIIPIRLENQTNNLQMTVDYQGCSKAGFCYPPMHKTFWLDMAAQSVAITQPTIAQDTIPELLTNQEQVQTLLQSQHVALSLGIFFIMGLLLAFTPCVLPMIPILTSIIVGHQKPGNGGRAFKLSLTYVLGSSLTYALAGVIAVQMGRSLQVWLQQPIVIAFTSAIFALLALSLFGWYDLQLPRGFQHRLITLSNKQRGGTYIGVFLMGIISSLIVSPCITAPLVGVLLYIGQSGNNWFGASALFIMGLGMGVPLMLIGTSVGKWMPKSGPWMDVIKKLFGLMMLSMAIWMLARIASFSLMIMCYVFLLFCFAWFFGIYLARFVGLKKLSQLLGIGTATFASLLLVLSIAKPNLIMQYINSQPQTSFIVVHNVEDLTKQLNAAQAAKQPVILDFYADWCDSCVTMDKKVFSEPTVKKELHSYLLLRADLSNNTQADEALLKYFNVIAPPTILFFDNKGKETNAERIVGEVNASEFLTRLSEIKQNCKENVKC